uniref:Uncharacterized protein n=1 Tax=Lactuca sativa TaxID=4236 RepID=A0A9R1X1V5_LACSA|nr:hypothetical protein LSAT_V11C800429820 [Lactuca sativa]
MNMEGRSRQRLLIDGLKDLKVCFRRMVVTTSKIHTLVLIKTKIVLLIMKTKSIFISQPKLHHSMSGLDHFMDSLLQISTPFWMVHLLRTHMLKQTNKCNTLGWCGGRFPRLRPPEKPEPRPRPPREPEPEPQPQEG